MVSEVMAFLFVVFGLDMLVHQHLVLRSEYQIYLGERVQKKVSLQRIKYQLETQTRSTTIPPLAKCYLNNSPHSLPYQSLHFLAQKIVVR